MSFYLLSTTHYLLLTTHYLLLTTHYLLLTTHYSLLDRLEVVAAIGGGGHPNPTTLTLTLALALTRYVEHRGDALLREVLRGPGEAVASSE